MITKLGISLVTFTPSSCHLCHLNDINNLQRFVNRSGNINNGQIKCIQFYQSGWLL